MNDIRKKLILSADDFDADPKANRRILSLAETGKIDRVGIIVEDDFTPEEIKRLLRSGVKLDLHLALEGLNARRHCSGESAFKRSFTFAVKYCFGRLSGKKIEAGWEKQIEKFEKIFGRRPDGINSHQHIHYFPPYFKVALKLAQKHKISYMRFGQKSLLKGRGTNVYRILLPLQKKNARSFRVSGLQSSDHMTSLDWIANLPKFLGNLPPGKTELICHPEREKEFRLLEKTF